MPPTPRITKPTRTISIEGLEFQYGTNEAFEFYYHEDEKLLCWQVARRLNDECGAWFATVSEPGAQGRVLTLNATGVDSEADGPLAQHGIFNSYALLIGISDLIKAGRWPGDESEGA